MGTTLLQPVAKGIQWDPTGKRDFVTAQTVNDALTVGQSGQLFTNRGATGTIVFTLPARPVKGMWYRFFVVAAQQMTLTPAATHSFVWNGAVQTAGYSLALTTIGTHCVVRWDGTAWLVCDPTGYFQSQA